MGDQPNNNNNNNDNSVSDSQRTESVRSRWIPKPEQIIILETFFNNGMVNPQKEEIVRIRKLLEKFGAVGDTNVFYWFQNRRSRSRRRQRQLEAAQLSRNNNNTIPTPAQDNSYYFGFTPIAPVTTTIPYNSVVGSSSSSIGTGNDHDGSIDENLAYLASICQHQPIDGNSLFCPLEINQYGIITVFINGVATEVEGGPLDVKAMFGEDLMLFHSSGIPIAVNDYGILLEPLHHGESYFLVPRQA